MGERALPVVVSTVESILGCELCTGAVDGRNDINNFYLRASLNAASYF